MPIQPTKSNRQQKDYQYFNHAGVPTMGKLPLMNVSEYDATVVRGGKCGYGMFPVSDPSHKCCDRTLKQVLDRAYANEYEIIDMERYNNGVVTQADEPPAVFVYVVWFEKFDTLPQHAKKIAQQNS